jgi:hypothetical protein
MSRFKPFPFNTVRLWRSGHVVKSMEGWAPVHRYAKTGPRSELHDDISALRELALSPEDETRRKRLTQFWTKLTPTGNGRPGRGLT